MFFTQWKTGESRCQMASEIVQMNYIQSSINAHAQVFEVEQ